MSERLKVMLTLQRASASVKKVSAIGKLVHYDSRLHHAIKSCSVAIMFDLMDQNKFLDAVACATDSVFVKHYVDVEQLSFTQKYFPLDVNQNIPIKVENVFKHITFLGNIGKYIGILNDNEVLVKGYSYPRTKPVAECELIKVLARALMLTTSEPLRQASTLVETVQKEINLVLVNIKVEDLIYPVNAEDSKTRHHPKVYFESNFCQDRRLVLHSSAKSLKALGYDEYAILPQCSPWYEIHKQGCDGCFCNNCSARRTVDLLDKKIYVGCCFGPDYREYAIRWRAVTERFINDVFKHSSMYNTQEPGALDNKKDLNLKLITVIEHELQKWSERSTVTTGFVPFGGYIQVH